MSPKNNTNSKKVGKSAAKNSRDLIPHSIVSIPPSVPPMVSSNPKRKVVLDFEAVAAAGALNVTVGDLRNFFSQQLAIPNGGLYFNIHYIHVWGAISPTAASSLSLLDTTYGTTSQGDNSNLVRARAGFCYPKNVTPLITNTTPGANVVCRVFKAVPVTTPLTFRVGITYWIVDITTFNNSFVNHAPAAIPVVDEFGILQGHVHQPTGPARRRPG